jgi:hypothetical protein
MATDKKSAPAKKKSLMMWGLSWARLLIAASVAANIAFVVLVIAMITTHELDGMFMNEGLTRYCLGANDDKFSDTSAKVKALRSYTCAAGDAKTYFNEGFQKYLDVKGIKD